MTPQQIRRMISVERDDSEWEVQEMELLPARVVSVAHADALRRKARKLMRTIDRAQKHALDSKEPYGSNAGSHRQEEGA